MSPSASPTLAPSGSPTSRPSQPPRTDDNFFEFVGMGRCLDSGGLDYIDAIVEPRAMGRRRLGETQTATTLGSAEGTALDEELTTRKLNTSPLPLYASKVRIQHNGEGEINIMEVEVYSGGNNVALQSNGGTAELSSTHSSSNSNFHLAASTAIDGDTSNGYKFAHSNLEDGAYLEIDLGQVYNIESVRIFNRPGFEDRLSDSTVTLRSPSDEVLYTYEIGDASSLSTIDISASDFDPTSPSKSPSTSPSKSPTLSPSVSVGFL
ncbi:hypothetical protein THAOC_25578 [Thalassiosira oceanica]|uniref:Uncharacterized protein n=1 Tax=Thalassiosira oceanica TaxID=159749 RepID=K0S7I3_THAOC|nr:hypothetical protein THAOC_25578 [Thalassiosira oceanica]|eukprot:EJK54767.1 hypothetical protein THAOC_25578 [Thalassiosira oceanica]